uniref:Ion_trans domain-containing protein n=1 Tax=Macrostomum lignano TaxID=282301 RepID=A0A1I8JDL1_9PLAT
TEYVTLVEQCMNFACEMMDLCRGTQEVEAVISDNLEASEVCGTNVRDPLGRLRMAIRYEEKKFVGHANCQQYLTSIWYGSETAFLQSWSLVRKVGLSLVAAPLLPLICIVYIVLPTSKVSKGLRCPAAKFATHTVSHFLFLVLLAAATFRVDDSSVTHSVSEEAVRDNYCTSTEERKLFLKKMLRPESTVITPVQILIILWTAGHLLSEIKQVYFQGLKEVALNAYSMLNFFILTLYIASYTIRIIVDLKIKEANHCYNATQQANEFLVRNISYMNITRTKDLEERFNNFLFQLRLNATCRQYMYFLEASRFKWVAHDPEIVSDVLFAVANVLSFARTIFLMPAFEVLGPLQISFSRMLTDIARFLVLFALVLLAFMVGMHNLYWYYGLQRIAKMVEIGNQTFAVDEPASEPFEGLVHTMFTMFWAMFSNFQLASLPIKHPNFHDDVQYQYKDGMIRTNSSTEVVETVGMTLMAFYHVIIIIVLINMLIAMMSHSFEDIQSECDVEWKFARTKLWLNYIDNGSTLPVPYNLLPTPQSVARAYRFVRRFFSNQSVFASESTRSTAFIKTRRDAVCKSMDIVAQDTSYADIMQRLVRRYLFKLERENDVEDVQKNPKEGISIRAEDMIGASPEGLFAQDDSKAVHFAEADIGMDEPADAAAAVVEPASPFSSGGPRRTASGKFCVYTGRLVRRCCDADESNFNRRSGHRQTMSSSSRGRGPSAQSDQLNLAAGNVRIKEEIQLLRDLIGENQKALLSLVRAVQQIQETTRMLNNNMQQWVTQQSASLSLKTMLVNEAGSTSEDPQQSQQQQQQQQQSSDASGSNKSSKRREKYRVKDSKV